MNWEIIEENAGLAKIKVIGVGGAGGNAVIHMINPVSYTHLTLPTILLV